MRFGDVRGGLQRLLQRIPRQRIAQVFPLRIVRGAQAAAPMNSNRTAGSQVLQIPIRWPHLTRRAAGCVPRSLSPILREPAFHTQNNGRPP
jgi:hypothetical protein